MTASDKRSERLITRRVAAGFGLVSVVAIVMSGVLISLIARVSGTVHDMRGDESAIKASKSLATSLREQYIHQAHTIIDEDDSHLDHYGDWVKRVNAEIALLAELVPDSEKERLAAVAAGSRELDTLFRSEIVPAIRSGDRSSVGPLHLQAEQITTKATEDADAIARAVEARMARAHRSATRFTRIGMIAGGIGVGAVLLLSALFTLRLRRAVLAPLGHLVRAANRFGRGDFESRVGEVGEGEFRDVASAFDSMAGELEARENRIIHNERMAAIGQLAAGVAHEINNPIQVIRGYLKTMGPDPAPETLAEELAILDEEAAACQRIAEDLVAYARSPDLAKKPTEVGGLLRETTKRFAETPEGHEITVDVAIEDDTVSLDGPRLRQVILNLLINAAQVSTEGNAIELSSTKTVEAYVIEISDRGPGIDEADRERIFEPFFSKRAGGSGLGLAVSSGIVRAHGGTLAALDRPGGGTTLQIRIPREGSEGTLQ